MIHISPEVSHNLLHHLASVYTAALDTVTLSYCYCRNICNAINQVQVIFSEVNKLFMQLTANTSTGLPTLTLVKLVDGDGKTGNPNKKGGDLYWSIERAEVARLQVPKALAPRGGGSRDPENL